MRGIRLFALAALVVIASLLGDARPAAAICVLGIGDCGVNLKTDVNAKLQFDTNQVVTVVQQIDRDNNNLLNATAAAVNHGLDKENKAIADTVHSTTAQISQAIKEQLQQVATASSDVVNQVADRVDLQLQSLLQQAKSVAAGLESSIASLETKIAADLNRTVSTVLADVRQKLEQIHRDVLDILGKIGEFISDGVNQFYARSQDVAQTAHVQLVADVGHAVLFGTKAVLALGLLVLVWITARQTADYVNKRKTGVPLEPIVAGVLLVGGVVLLADRPLLPAMLGVDMDVASRVDVCTQAEQEYTTFQTHAGQHLEAESLRLEGGRVEEDLSHCAYSTLSKERSIDAHQRIAGVVQALHPAQQAVAKK